MTVLNVAVAFSSAVKLGRCVLVLTCWRCVRLALRVGCQIWALLNSCVACWLLCIGVVKYWGCVLRVIDVSAVKCWRCLLVVRLLHY